MTLISYMLRENEGERNAGSIGWDIPITQKFFQTSSGTEVFFVRHMQNIFCCK